MDSRERAQWEQQLTSFRETIPLLWYTIYRGALQAGFNEKQAFTCVTTYILSQNPSGIRPDAPPTPETKE